MEVRAEVGVDVGGFRKVAFFESAHFVFGEFETCGSELSKHGFASLFVLFFFAEGFDGCIFFAGQHLGVGNLVQSFFLEFGGFLAFQFAGGSQRVGKRAEDFGEVSRNRAESFEHGALDVGSATFFLFFGRAFVDAYDKRLFFCSRFRDGFFCRSGFGNNFCGFSRCCGTIGNHSAIGCSGISSGDCRIRLHAIRSGRISNRNFFRCGFFCLRLFSRFRSLIFFCRSLGILPHHGIEGVHGTDNSFLGQQASEQRHGCRPVFFFDTEGFEYRRNGLTDYRKQAVFGVAVTGSELVGLHHLGFIDHKAFGERHVFSLACFVFLNHLVAFIGLDNFGRLAVNIDIHLLDNAEAVEEAKNCNGKRNHLTGAPDVVAQALPAVNHQGLELGQVIRRKFHHKVRSLALEKRPLQEQTVSDGEQHTGEVKQEHHRARHLAEECRRKQCIHREACAAAHERHQEDGEEAFTLGFQHAGAHNGRHAATEAHHHRHEGTTGEPEESHETVCNESRAGHVTRVFEERKAQEHEEDDRDECRNRLDTGTDTVGENCRDKGGAAEYIAQQVAKAIHENRTEQHVKEINERRTDRHRNPEH